MSIVNEFLLNTTRYYREYDAAAFVGNSNNAIRGTSEPVAPNASIDLARRALDSAKEQLESTIMDGRQFAYFVAKIKESPRYENMGSFPAMAPTDVQFKLDYLKEYIQNCNIVTDKLISGGTPEETMGSARVVSDRMSSGLRKQVVRGDFDLTRKNPKDMLARSIQPTVPYTREYVLTEVIPFIKDFPNTKNATLLEIAKLKTYLNEVEICLKARSDAGTKLCNAKPELCQAINQFMYLNNRDILETMNYITYALLYKVNGILTNARTCNKFISHLGLLTESTQDYLYEGVYEKNLISEDTGNVADALVHNDTSAFEELANNIWAFHRDALLPRFAHTGVEDPEQALIMELEKYKYDVNSYNSVMEILSTIGASLDSISASSDDYLLVCDEIVKKAGLDNPVDIRYRNIVEGIKVPTYVNQVDAFPDGNFPGYMYCLQEVKEFPKNIKVIATAIHDIYKRIEILETRYEMNVNQEYKNLNAIEELRVFLKEFRDQFGNLVHDIADAYITRLKKMGRYAELNLSKFLNREIAPENVVEFVDDTDYALEIDKILLEYEEAVTDLLMDELLQEHNRQWIKKTQHLDVIQEVGDPVQKAPGTQPNSNGQNANADGSSQADPNANPTDNTAKANAEATRKRSIADKLRGIRDGLKNRFQEMLNKFRENMNKRTLNESVDVLLEAAVQYNVWLHNNEQALLNRSYNNVSLNILPYATRMPFNQIMTEVHNFANMINGFKPGDVSNLHSEADIFNRLYSAQGVVNLKPNTSIADCKSTAATALTKYYKVGKAPLEMVTYANGQLKNLMADIVNFCKTYYETDQERLITALTSIQRNADRISSSFVTESVDMIYNEVTKLYQEADEKAPSTTPTVTTTGTNTAPTATNQKQPTAKDGMTPSTMIQTIHEGAAIYSGAVLNAVRDRVSDYFKAMQALVPKNANRNAPNQNQNQ